MERNKQISLLETGVLCQAKLVVAAQNVIAAMYEARPDAEGRKAFVSLLTDYKQAAEELKAQGNLEGQAVNRMQCLNDDVVMLGEIVKQQGAMIANLTLSLRKTTCDLRCLTDKLDAAEKLAGMAGSQLDNMSSRLYHFSKVWADARESISTMVGQLFSCSQRCYMSWKETQPKENFGEDGVPKNNTELWGILGEAQDMVVKLNRLITEMDKKLLVPAPGSK